MRKSAKLSLLCGLSQETGLYLTCSHVELWNLCEFRNITQVYSQSKLERTSLLSFISTRNETVDTAEVCILYQSFPTKVDFERAKWS
jgi:hypothetical protein